MRRLALCLLLAGCGEPELPEPVEADRSAIAYGNADTAHTAVVALLTPAGGTNIDVCSGTIVQVRGGSAYVLSAAHCCDQTAPTVVVMSDDLFVGLQYVGRLAPLPPAYAVTPGSVRWDSRYGGTSQPYDFCMLKFAAPPGTPSIPVPAGPDGLSTGANLDRVGYGVTQAGGVNYVRRIATSPVDQALTSTTFTSSQGGGGQVPGICLGDSGGPVLAPAGSAPGLQRVVGVTSTSDSSTCSQNTQNTAMRVSSETQDGGFITRFLADSPIGTQPPATPAGCFTCTSAAQTGSCSGQTQACVNDPACIALAGCLPRCMSQACINACRADAGVAAVTAFADYRGCVCWTGCLTQCASTCGPPPPDAGTQPPDAGTPPPDAGRPDAGSTADAGTNPPDAGPRPDAGNPQGDGGAIVVRPVDPLGPEAQHGCAIAPHGAWWLAALLLLRRRYHPVA